MATDDRQVLVTGKAPTPAHFRIPGNGQLRPKAVTAHYDGSGAGSAFLAALKVTSDAGELVGVYPISTAIAAGASARVSWFPGVKPGAAAAATYGDWAQVDNGSPPGDTIPAGMTSPVTFQHFYTSNPSLFSTGLNQADTGHNTPGDSYLLINPSRPLTLTVVGWAGFFSGAGQVGTSLFTNVNSSPTQVGAETPDSVGTIPFAIDASRFALGSKFVGYLEPGIPDDAYIQIQVTNNSGVDAVVENVYIQVAVAPATGPFTTVY